MAAKVALEIIACNWLKTFTKQSHDFYLFSHHWLSAAITGPLAQIQLPVNRLLRESESSGKRRLGKRKREEIGDRMQIRMELWTRNNSEVQN